MSALVGIVMGSDSDRDVMEKAGAMLDRFGIERARHAQLTLPSERVAHKDRRVFFSQRAQTGPHRWAADPHHAGQVALGRQPGARAEAAAVDQLPDVRDDGGGAIGRVRWLDSEGHDWIDQL